MANWYYKLEGTVHGPVTARDLAQLIRSGQVIKTTQVAKVETDEAPQDWVPAARIRGVKFPSAGSPTDQPTQSSGQTFRFQLTDGG